jgi:hypothetical protein
MSNILVPCVKTENDSSFLLKVHFWCGRQEGNYYYDTIQPIDPGNNSESEPYEGSDYFDAIYEDIMSYFTKTYKKFGPARTDIYPVYERNLKIYFTNSKRSVLLGVFLAVAQEVNKLTVNSDWQSVTATGSFKEPDSDGNLELNAINDDDYELKLKVCEKYANDVKRGKCDDGKSHLFLYVSKDKPSEYREGNSITIKSFSSTESTLFDILEYVFKLPNFPEGLTDQTQEKYFDDFNKYSNYNSNYNKKQRDNIFSICNRINLSDDFKNKHLFIHDPDDNKKYLAFQLARYMVWNRKIYAPILINIDLDPPKPDGNNMPPIEIRTQLYLSLFTKEKGDPNPTDCLNILRDKPFLIIIDNIPKDVDSFIGRMKVFCDQIREMSRIIFIAKTNFDSKKINWIEPFPMPQEIADSEISVEPYMVPESATDEQMPNLVCNAGKIEQDWNTNSLINGIYIGWTFGDCMISYRNMNFHDDRDREILKDIMSNEIICMVKNDNLGISIGEEPIILIEKILGFYREYDIVKYDSILIGMVAYIANDYLKRKNWKSKNEALELMLNRFQLMGENIISKENQAKIFTMLKKGRLIYDTQKTFYFLIKEFITSSVLKEESIILNIPSRKTRIYRSDITSLTEGQWNDVNIKVKKGWYSFAVNKGKKYYIWWNGWHLNDRTKEKNVKASAFYWNGYSVFTNLNSTWNHRKCFTAEYTGTIYVSINPSSYGFCSIVYSTIDIKPTRIHLSNQLLENQWKDISFTGSVKEIWCSFNVIRGKHYHLWGQNTAISIFYNNMIPYFEDDSPFSPDDFLFFDDSPCGFVAKSTGMVYIKVSPFSHFDGHRIMYRTSRF